VKVAIGFAALVVAQYRAYREIWWNLNAENEKRTERTELVMFAEGRSALYVERPGGAANSIGFYLELELGVQNGGDQNSVIRKFDLEIQEVRRTCENISPSRRNSVQTRSAQHMMRNVWISQQPTSIVVPSHNVCSGILGFYVPGEADGLPEQVHCRLRLEDTVGTSAEYTFLVPVVD
jgi:hypothetical protein